MQKGYICFYIQKHLEPFRMNHVMNNIAANEVRIMCVSKLSKWLRYVCLNWK